MKFTFTSTLFLVAVTLAPATSAHGVITNIVGANGKNGTGFGVTDVNGTHLSLFNQASRLIKGSNATCGEQKLDGKTETAVNLNAELSKAVMNGLPTAAADGTITMTLFQVNGDGAGPYNCEVSADGTGTSFMNTTTTTQVPGTGGSSSASNKAFPLNIKLPANTKCTGPGGSCLVRCKNGNSQPFGGCLAVAQSASAIPTCKSVTRAIKEARFHEDAQLSARSSSPAGPVIVSFFEGV